MKKCMIVAVLFYGLGVFGAGGGYFADNMDKDYSLGDQVIHAVEVGVTWPYLAYQLILGA